MITGSILQFIVLGAWVVLLAAGGQVLATFIPVSASRSILAEFPDDNNDLTRNSDAPPSPFADFNSTVMSGKFWDASQTSTFEPDRLFGDLSANGFFDFTVVDVFANSDYSLTFAVPEVMHFIISGRVGGLSGRGLITLTGPAGTVFQQNSNSDNVEDPYINLPSQVSGFLPAGEYTLAANARTYSAVLFAGADLEFVLSVPEPSCGAMTAVVLASLMFRRDLSTLMMLPIQ